MEKEKFKLLFYLKRGTQDKNGKSPIMGRISAGSSMVQFSCKCSCTPRLWDSRKNRLLGKSAEAVSVNKELDRLQVSIHKVYESLSGKSDARVTAERVRELVFGLNSESQGLLYHTGEYINRFRERVGIDRSERRLKMPVALPQASGKLRQVPLPCGGYSRTESGHSPHQRLGGLLRQRKGLQAQYLGWLSLHAGFLAQRPA